MTDATATPKRAASAATPPAASAATRKKQPGRRLAALALLLALAAGGAAGYAVWRIEFANPVETRLASEATRLQRAIDQARAAASDDLTEHGAALADALGGHRQALDELRGELAAALVTRRHDEPRDARDWKLAEAEYLLRIANGRLLMERDVAAARQLLAAADALLEELDDFALHEVRTALATERLALAQASAATPQTLFLGLEAVKDALAGLPTKPPSSFEADAPAATSAAGSDAEGEAPTVWQQLRERLAGLFEYRTRASLPPRPLLRPDEALYLELNLRLALERAQLGALRSDAVLYTASLASARRWLAEYVDMEDPRTKAIAAELAPRAELDAPLPDISRSLALLREVTRSPAPDNEAAAADASQPAPQQPRP